MGDYQTKALAVRAVRWTENGVAESPAPAWCGKIANKGPEVGGVMNIDGEIHCFTPHGVLIAKPGDWLVLDANGNVYPCTDEAFQAMYEPHPGGP